MKLHTVFISYNRLELTKRAIESYRATVTGDDFYVRVVDNGSTDGTGEWLGEASNQDLIDDYFLLGENRYPGYACNYGWEETHTPVTHFHRADNDHIFLPGWCEEAERMFQDAPTLGQLGLRTDEEELFVKMNTGGNCIIKRELWDLGLRWDERSWPQLREEVGPGFTEDSLLSHQVKKMNYYWDRVERPCIQPISHESADDPYYIRSWTDRGIRPSR
jgi:glycosyltransferase involved in cell wall biosynthesis